MIANAMSSAPGIMIFAGSFIIKTKEVFSVVRLARDGTKVNRRLGIKG
jgi:hypothetical protein